MTEPNTSIDQFRQRTQDVRRIMAQRLAPNPAATSVNGYSFSYKAPLDVAIPLGGYVRISTANGNSFLGQIISRDLTEREGPELQLEGDAGLSAGVEGVTIAGTAFRLRLQIMTGSGVLLGRITADGIRPMSPDDVFDEAGFALATASDVDQFFSGKLRGQTTLDIGCIKFDDNSARARLQPSGFSRHTFLCGQSGSGKTFSLGVTLERLLLETDLRMIIIDPNSDFVKLGQVRPFEAVAKSFGGMLSPEAYTALKARYEERAKGVGVYRHTPRGTQSQNALRIRFSDLHPLMQGLVLQLDPLRDREELNAFSSIVAHLGKSDYSLADVQAAASRDLSADARQIALRIANLGVADWDVWAEDADPTPTHIFASTQRVAVLDIGGFELALEKSLVSAAVLGGLWNRREQREPVLIVIDEAHNVCPQEPSDPIQAIATERAVRIAGEGRKFGLYMLVSTQRPQKIHTNVLSQCDNLMLMRMNSAGDLEHLRETFSFVPGSLFDRATSFGQGEALIGGKIVPAPLLAGFQGRISEEGGSDVPTTWATAKS